MSQSNHPVGYRPQIPPSVPAMTPAVKDDRPRAPRGCGCASLVRIVALVWIAIIGGAAYVIFTSTLGDGERLERRLEWLTDKIDDATRWLEPAPRATTDVELPEAERSAVLDTGQVIEGDFQIVTIEDHLEAGDVDKALAVAIEKDPAWLRRLLDEHGVDPDQRIVYGPDSWANPLEKSVRQGSWETFQILLEAGADVNGVDSEGDSALHFAAQRGYAEIVDELLARGADVDLLRLPPDATDREAAWRQQHVGATPLEAAASGGHRQIVDRLLAAGATPRYALHAAASSGSVELIDLFLELGADPRQKDPYDEGPLRYAVMAGSLEAVERLLGAGARPGEQALREAARGGHDRILRAFYGAGVRFDGPPTYWGPLYTAAHAGQASTVELLLKLGASTDAYEGLGRPIDAAREQGHAEVVALLEGR